MNKSRAFTLVELLAVIVILSFILAISVPTISKMIDSVKVEAYNQDEKMIVKVTKNYLASETASYPTNIGDTIEIKLSDLQANNYIGTIKSPSNNAIACDGYAIVTKISQSTYDYAPHLDCINGIGSIAEDQLVGHWKFDDFQETTQNLYQGPSSPGLYMTSVYNGNYGFGETTNSKWEIDNSDQPIPGIDIQKISRIQSGINQIFYVQWTDLITRSGAVNFLPGEEKTISFYYYGTYGTSINPYIGGQTGNIVLYADNAISGNGSTSIVLPVIENKWNRVIFKIKNIGTTNTAYSWGWMILHSNSTTAILDNTHFWKFAGIQIEKKGYVTPYVNGTRLDIIKDYSGVGNYATLLADSTPKWVADSKVGQGAYQFNGINNYADIGLSKSGTSLNVVSEMTTMFWVKFNNSPDSTRVGNIIGNYGVSPHFNIEGYTNGRLRYYWNGGEIDYTVPKDLRGSWHHVAITRKASENKTIIYIDGKVEATLIAGASGNIVWPIRIGNDYRGGVGIPYNGLLDEIRIYNRALAQMEIEQIYNSQK